MFDDQWAELEAEAAGAGEVRRRIHPGSPADLWLVVYGAGMVRAAMKNDRLPWNWRRR